MNPLITVRLATAADVDGIAAMSRDLVEDGLPWTWQPMRVLRALRGRSTNIAVASEERMLLGFGIMRYDDDEAHLLLFAVHPQCQRHGVGTTILEWLEDVARTAGLRRVLVECRRDNAVGRRFYVSQRYREFQVVRGYYGAVDAIRLEKKLRVTGE